MEVSIHGLERIYSRTKMRTEDVIMVLENNVCVSLGTDEVYEYLLFYSPNDQAEKIAVVTLKEGTLISIWNSDFWLPPGIKEPTHAHRREVQNRLQRFLLNQITAKREMVRVMLEVIYRTSDKVEYSSDLGEMPREKFSDLSRVLKHFRKPVREVFLIVENQTKFYKEAVKYRFVAHKDSDPFWRKRQQISHRTLKKKYF